MHRDDNGRTWRRAARNEKPTTILPLTPRLPIEGEPHGCKQEVADNVVTAGCTNGTVEKAEPQVADADVDRTALLGGEPAERASGVDEGDGTEHEPPTQLQQMKFYCKENCQRNENANDDVPNAHGLPLEGEWNVCVSGEVRDLRGSANAPNATPECVHRPSESRETEDVEGVESEGHEGGTSERASVDEAIVKCCQQLCMADTPNEPDVLVTRSMESESPNSGETPRVRLGSVHWPADDANGLGSRTEMSEGQTEMSRAQTDALNTHKTDGIESHVDGSIGRRDTPSVQTDTLKPANATEIVRTPQKRKKPPNLPSETASRTPDEPNGIGDRTDGSSVHTDTHTVANATETAANDSRNIRTRQNDQKTRNSPTAHEIERPKPTYQRKRVGTGDGDVYVPWNAPVEALGRAFVFGRLESACEEIESGEQAIAPSVEGKRAGDGNSGRNGDGGDDGGDGDEGSTTSSGGVDSTRVNAALLAILASQQANQSRRMRKGNVPVSSRPPIRHPNRLYGDARRRRRRGRTKVEAKKISQTRKVKTAYLKRVRTAQPPRNDSKCLNGVIGPRRRRDRIKIEPRNISRTQKDRNAYLGRVIALRSNRRPRKRLVRFNKLTFKYRMPGEYWRNDGDYG